MQDLEKKRSGESSGIKNIYSSLTKSASSAVTRSTVSPVGEFSETIPAYGAFTNWGELSFTSPIDIETVA